MKEFFRQFIEVSFYPDAFFERIREEKNWKMPLMHLLVLTLWLSIASVIAWGLGVRGDTPLIFVVFRYLGGARESGGLLRAFQGFVYGLSPAVFGGFLPVLGLTTGVYTTILQLQRGPSITMKNRTVASYLLWVVVMAYAIARYWQGSLL